LSVYSKFKNKVLFLSALWRNMDGVGRHMGRHDSSNGMAELVCTGRRRTD